MDKAECSPLGPGDTFPGHTLGWELRRLLELTESRDGYHASFLHDVKVYFAAACYDRLVENGVLTERRLRITSSRDGTESVTDAESAGGVDASPNAFADDASQADDMVVTEVCVAPDRSIEYNCEFARWLEASDRVTPEIEALVTDPGCGHNGHAKGNWLIAQDCDDDAVMLLAPRVGRVYVCDETPLLSRSVAVLARHSGKVVEGIVMPRHSAVMAREGQVLRASMEECSRLAVRARAVVASGDVVTAVLLDTAYSSIAEAGVSFYHRFHFSDKSLHRSLSEVVSECAGEGTFDVVAVAVSEIRAVESTHGAPRDAAPLTARAAELCAAIDAGELEAVHRQCFVPTLAEVDELLVQSARAAAEAAAGRRTTLLSKLPHVDALCPPSLDPNDTILVRLARSRGRVGDSRCVVFRFVYFGCAFAAFDFPPFLFFFVSGLVTVIYIHA